MSNMKMFSFNRKTTEYVESLGFEEYTPIQLKVIPLAKKKKDIIGISATGTGKTHAFLIPVFDGIDVARQEVQAVICAPTRELARQIYERAVEYNEIDPSVSIRLVSGEVEKSRMENQLKNQPHIVIGTPGRLKDAFLQSQVLRLDTADVFVVDEADMTLEFGFLDDVDQVCGRMKENLQMMVFSATIPQNLQPFLRKYLHEPTVVEIKKQQAQAKVTHILVPCKHMDYKEKLLKILPGFQPYVCLIFANTRKYASEVAEALRSEGYDVTEVHGDLTTRQRKNAMKDVMNQNATYIVATDIAARGIDIEAVSHVVSLGFPNALEYYVHRSGRTGRASLDGVCYALYNDKDEASIRSLKGKGILFEHQDYKGGNWIHLLPYGQKRTRKNDVVDKEIAKMLTKKNQKVKPGYKKKRQQEIEKIKRKQRRQMIQDSIKAQTKERAKQKQREKRLSNADR
ncbi:MAG: DEAD/DEAH box helicase [Erysipelotrichaceae bacterium]|nr:DEAD/DEAH box helicase [Erysipelotrichaceae bacterium]